MYKIKNTFPTFNLFNLVFDPNAAIVITNNNVNSKPTVVRQPPTPKTLPQLSEIPFKTVDSSYFENK